MNFIEKISRGNRLSVEPAWIKVKVAHFLSFVHL